MRDSAPPTLPPVCNRYQCSREEDYIIAGVDEHITEALKIKLKKATPCSFYL
jgi:hypothetical protein